MNTELLRELLLSESLKPSSHFIQRSKQRKVWVSQRKVADTFRVLSWDGDVVKIAYQSNHKNSVIVIIDVKSRKMITVYRILTRKIKEEII